MAEFVEYRLERSVKELEVLQSLSIFSEDEIKEIVKRRTQFEYQLQRHKKLTVYYLDYIHYEDTLLRLIELRRKKLGLPKGVFREEVEHAISRRIDQLYRQACFKHPGDKQLWLNYIEFCKLRKWYGRVSALYYRMLQVHSHDPKLWLASAHFEFKYNDATDAVRNLLLQALRFHSNEKTIWLNLFRFEYLFAHKVHERSKVLDLRHAYPQSDPSKEERQANRKKKAATLTEEQISKEEREEAADAENAANLEALEDIDPDNIDDDQSSKDIAQESSKASKKHGIISGKRGAKNANDWFGSTKRSDNVVLSGELLRIVYHRAIKTIDPELQDPDFCFSFFQVLNSRHENEIVAVEKLKEDILSDLRTRYQLKESTWEMIAKELRGGQIDSQISLYEQAIEDLPTPQMWSYYLEFVSKLLEEQTSEEDANKHLAYLLQLYERSWKQQAMSTLSFSEWINLLNSTAEPYSELENHLKQLLHAGINKWPSEKLIWAQFFSIHGERSSLKLDKREGKLLFERCIKNIASKYAGNDGDELPILELIKIYLAWLQQEVNSPSELVSTIDQLSRYNYDHHSSRVTLNRRIWAVVKPMALDITHKVFGLLKAKLYYEKNRFQQPIVPQFFDQMIKILSSALENAKSKVEEDELKCDLKSVYEDYLRHFGAKDYRIWLDLIKLAIEQQDNVSKIGLLYTKAIKTLEPSEVDKFAEQYTVLKAQGKI